MIKIDCSVDNGEKTGGELRGNMPKLLFEFLVILENLKEMDSSLKTGYICDFLKTKTFIDFMQEDKHHDNKYLADFVAAYTISKRHYEENVDTNSVKEEDLKDEIHFIKSKIFEDVK